MPNRNSSLTLSPVRSVISQEKKQFIEGLCVLGGALELRSLPLCPELRLWLLHDAVDLNERVLSLLHTDEAPYWAFCWGAGQALSRYVLDHPEFVRGKRVIDFGAGSAVAGIAAMRAGAASVIAVDIDAVARQIATCNAEENAVTLATASEVPDDWDVLLASDVLYESNNDQLIERAATAGRDVLLSDPMRHGTLRTTRLALEAVADYRVNTVPNVDYPIDHAFVYRLGRDA